MSKSTPPIERADTGIRLLYSAILLLIAELVQIILGCVTAFSLAYAFVTQQPPSEQVRRFANRTLSYLYQIFRYVTYNTATLPFPFSDFPAEQDKLDELDEPDEPDEPDERDRQEAVASEQPKTQEREYPPARVQQPRDTQSSQAQASDDTPEGEHRLL